MRITTRKAHPQGKGRPVTRRYTFRGTGSSASGAGTLPDDTDCVSVTAYACDGADLSTSTRVHIAFGLDDDVRNLDALIGRLTDLLCNIRAKRRVRARADDDTDVNPNDRESARRDRGLPARDGTT